VLIGFSNGIRGAERLTAPQALGDSDNDMSCHAREYGMGGCDSKTWGAHSVRQQAFSVVPPPRHRADHIGGPFEVESGAADPALAFPASSGLNAVSAR
jgi:hypothetical protein